jgi:hypothetical protein
VADLPRHPASDDDEDVATAGHSRRASWPVYIVGIVLVALFILMAVLHLTGVMGPGAHG